MKFSCRSRVLTILALLVLFTTIIISGCRKLVEVNAPVTSINAANVYKDDVTAIAVLTGIYAKISDNNQFLAGGSINSTTLFPALSADELTLNDLNNVTLLQYYRNDLDQTYSAELWRSYYHTLFDVNSAIEGLNASGTLTSSVKQQLLGEAKFIRAFCYFYLTNLFSDVPLITTTNWRVNAQMSRTPKAQVYQQMVDDLKDAQGLLSSNFVSPNLTSSTSERVRPNKWAASALLARVYLYTGDYAGAEAQATAVINNSALFGLIALNDVFLMNSTEAIWQLQPVRTGTESNTGEGALFILPPEGPTSFQYPVYLSSHIVNSFEAGDLRRSSWVDSVKVTVGASTITYHYAFKYKIGSVNTNTTEYIMVLRLAEQYLIRAEARAQLNNIAGSQADINIIRIRAGLPGTTAADKAGLIAATLKERKVELFTEWGHRWFDLKRTNSIDAVMSIVAPTKGGTWSSFKALYPLPLSELNMAPNLVQNPGY